MAPTHTRRRFIAGIAAVGAAGLVGAPQARAAEGALETTAIRLVNDGSICIAPGYAAEDLMRAEGFTDIRYVEIASESNAEGLARGLVDFAFFVPFAHIPAIDAGLPIVVLAGVHSGCFELFATEGIRSIADLKGKSVGLKAAPPALLILMAAQVGLDAVKDIRWVTDSSVKMPHELRAQLAKDMRWVADPAVKPLELFAERRIDAFLGFPPEPQELRARHAGHVIVNTSVDRPWSQYFCCMLASNRDFVRKHPVATKRVLRAVLKATDLCVKEPAQVARRIVDGGFTAQYDYAKATLNDVPYDRWRDYDAEDTMRFYALRLLDAGMIKSSPQKIIADGTDWRFLNEVKRELKA